MCAVGSGDPISLEVCKHHTLPRNEQECFRITIDKRCARPTYRRIADGLETRFVRSFVLRGSLPSVGAPMRLVLSAGLLRTRSAWPMGLRI